jgi:lipopolysaccharide transport system ATP-binding protein
LIKPDSGCVKFKGRIAPLIALGAGFNPILTGRENIYANMSILGLSKPEINERFDEVVDFAEIGDAIDAPVQSYSSGMAARLGFATAIYTEPDILLIDEVLAVGDIKFRAKCHRKLSELRQKNTSFILVSHQSQAILNVCDSSIYLANGKLIASGNTASIMNQYEEDLLIRGKEQYPGIMYIPEKPKSESLGLDIISVFFRDEKDNLIQFPISGESTNFCLECQVDKKIDNLSVYLAIREIAGENDLVLHLSSFYDQKNLSVSPGKCEMRVEMPYLGLKPGSYMIKVFIKQGSLQIIDLVDSFRFTVKGEGNSRNLFYQPREWKVVMENN